MSVTQRGPVPTEDPGSDLEYDLAHEARGEDTVVPSHEDEQITVVTGTPDYDGDYSYDLAHGIPGR